MGETRVGEGREGERENSTFTGYRPHSAQEPAMCSSSLLLRSEITPRLLSTSTVWSDVQYSVFGTMLITGSVPGRECGADDVCSIW